ncbi:AzlC family ABC transporter permease [Sporosarcina thermotolerans]|uniref:AzlC family ABC transporter permease n=1 Tax=Sporosarcina thermotolerans TaxID=633404 RepID=A0AAW9A748_9BACL|nr:AzlC family ABC transporter permease [Sporosarcina thermotolerans]MDW0116992.1 AzlC family ABC transporter permease [Sporosarcina thermotolerans]WHT49974.1 AzlC family ABC transporter permease [Sporosarcina thermotolerans]
MNNQFLSGLKSGLSIAIGYFPIALTFGLLANTGTSEMPGLSLIEATAMSMFVYAGAAQYMSLSLINSGVDPFTIVVNTFIVNIRHFLMTASLNEKMHRAPKWIKSIYAFGITDESFSVLAIRKEEKITTAFAFGVTTIAYGSWVIFTVVGYVIGANLPDFLQVAMSIALYAMFIGLLVPAMKGNRKVVMLASLAAAIHSIIYFGELLSTGWAILVSTLSSAILVEVIYSRRGKNTDSDYIE